MILALFFFIQNVISPNSVMSCLVIKIDVSINLVDRLIDLNVQFEKTNKQKRNIIKIQFLYKFSDFVKFVL